MAVFQDALAETFALEFPLGQRPDGSIAKADLTKINHLLVCGATGSGKSVFVNSALLSLLFHNTPDKLRIILCDTKLAEFSQYKSVGHLLANICSDEQKIMLVLRWAESEAKKRLRLFSGRGVRDISSYNDLTWEKFGEEMPHVVIVVDDISNVVRACPEVVETVAGIFSFGRAVGIHLIAITQTPLIGRTKQITSLFLSKAIFPIASLTDYRALTGKRAPPQLSEPGDMLFCCGVLQERVRAFVPGGKNTSDILNSVSVENTSDLSSQPSISPEDALSESDFDELLPFAIDVTIETGMASVSMLQRRLKLGYSRAARLVDQMEEKGVVGPFEGSKPRQILITRDQWEKMNHIESKPQEETVAVTEVEVQEISTPELAPEETDWKACASEIKAGKPEKGCDNFWGKIKRLFRAR